MGRPVLGLDAEPIELVRDCRLHSKRPCHICLAFRSPLCTNFCEPPAVQKQGRLRIEFQCIVIVGDRFVEAPHPISNEAAVTEYIAVSRRLFGNGI